MDKFTFFRSYYEALKAMPKKDRADAIMAMCAYAFDDDAAATAPGSGAVLLSVSKPIIDKSKKRSDAGKAGTGNKSKSKSNLSEQVVQAKSDSPEQVVQAKTDLIKKSFKEYEYEYESEYENESEVENESETLSSPTVEEREADACAPAPHPAKNGRFVPPSVTDVEAYCAESGCHIDEGAFVDFYASKGWKIGTSPMKDWKSAVRNWERRDKKSGDGNAGKTFRPKNGPSQTPDAERAASDRDAIDQMRKILAAGGGDSEP